MLNEDELLDYIRRTWDVTVVSTSFSMPLRDAITLMQDTDVLMGMHGAGELACGCASISGAMHEKGGQLLGSCADPGHGRADGHAWGRQAASSTLVLSIECPEQAQPQ